MKPKLDDIINRWDRMGRSQRQDSSTCQERGSISVEIKSVSLALIISSVWHTDTSDDATGTIGLGDTESLVWTRTDASAPSGYPRPIEIPDEPGRYYFYVLTLNSTLGFYYETFAYPPLEEPIEYCVCTNVLSLFRPTY